MGVAVKVTLWPAHIGLTGFDVILTDGATDAVRFTTIAFDATGAVLAQVALDAI